MDYTIRIGGEAGQGMQTLGGTLAKIFSRLRYHVFTHQDYMSRIKGGHNYYQIRLSEKPLTASRTAVDILIALDRNTLDLHENDVVENGLILFDPEVVTVNKKRDIFQPIPFRKLALDEGGDKIMANTVAIGAVLGLFRLDYIPAEQVIRQSLTHKKHNILNGNKQALHAGYNHIQAQTANQDSFCISMPRHDNLMLINSTQAIAAGAVSAGCKFYAAYPMTPATGIMVYLAGQEREHNIIVEQAEDEISAINMALGASYAGVRSMTGTSGGGFALMTEGISLAGITETPIVICEVQRPGPATGLPTRTEQGDLLFVIHGGHGEFAKVVLTPGTPEQAFLAANKAFDLAEKYQIPVFIQSDQYLADAQWTYKDFPLNKLQYRDYRLRGKELARKKKYRRYAFTSNGISPLAVPGDSKHLVVVDSDEHDQDGHISEDRKIRTEMVKKRLFKKLRQLKQEINPPELYGSQNPEIILIGYGSTYGIIREAVDILSEKDVIAMLHFSEVYPFPLTDSFDYLSLLHNARQTICIELNAGGQFAQLLQTETAFHCSHKLISYDGRPFTIDAVLTEIKPIINTRKNKQAKAPHAASK